MKVSLVGLLGLLLIGLKLGGVIHWAWVWVLAPFWVGLVLPLLLLLWATSVVSRPYRPRYKRRKY